MARNNATGIDLGSLQTTLEESARELRSAQAAYLKAGDRFVKAQEENQAAIISINQAMTTLKSSVHVPHLLGK